MHRKTFHVTAPSGQVFTVIVDGENPIQALGKRPLPPGTYQLHALDDELTEYGRFSVDAEHRLSNVMGIPPVRRVPEDKNFLAGGAPVFRNRLHRFEYRVKLLDEQVCHLCHLRHDPAELTESVERKWRLDLQTQLEFEVKRGSLLFLEVLQRESTSLETIRYYQFAGHAEVHNTMIRLQQLNHWQSQHIRVKMMPSPAPQLFGPQPVDANT